HGGGRRRRWNTDGQQEARRGNSVRHPQRPIDQLRDQAYGSGLNEVRTRNSVRDDVDQGRERTSIAVKEHPQTRGAEQQPRQQSSLRNGGRGELRAWQDNNRFVLGFVVGQGTSSVELRLNTHHILNLTRGEWDVRWILRIEV